MVNLIKTWSIAKLQDNVHHDGQRESGVTHWYLGGATVITSDTIADIDDLGSVLLLPSARNGASKDQGT